MATDTTFTDLVTYTRSSDATYIDSTGSVVTVSPHTPRTDHHVFDGTDWVNEGLLHESEGATNILKGSSAPVNQTTYVSQGTMYTLHFTGSGSVDLVYPPATSTKVADYDTGAAAAYSLRYVSGSYTGPVVRVRRSSDNTEQDFTPTEIEDGSLETFVGTGDGLVTTWYDQSGNGNDATQATASEQPKIVDAGVLVTENGKAALDFDGENHYLENGSMSAFNVQSVFFVKKGIIRDSRSAVLGFPVEETGKNLGIYYWNESPAHYGFNTWSSDNWGVSPYTKFEDHTVEFALFRNGNPASSEVELYVNGTEYSLSQTKGLSETRTMANGFRISRGGAVDYQNYDGLLQEIIVYPSDQSSNRELIESNINDYYQIYPNFSLTGTGSGEENRVSGTFTPYGTGDMTVTVNGTVVNGQIEEGSLATSFIPTPTDGTATRSPESISIPATFLPDNTDSGVSIYLRGRVTLQDTDTPDQITLLDWSEDSGNYIRYTVSTDSPSTSGGRLVLAQSVSGTEYTVQSPDTELFEESTLGYYNIGGAHSSSRMNGGADGVTFSENTSVTGIPDLSRADVQFLPQYMGTLKAFRVFGEDVGDTGLVQLTEPPTDATLSLNFNTDTADSSYSVSGYNY